MEKTRVQWEMESMAREYGGIDRRQTDRRRAEVREALVLDRRQRDRRRQLRNAEVAHWMNRFEEARHA